MRSYGDVRDTIQARALERRIREIKAENARAAAAAKRCPVCGCTRAARCVLDLGDGGMGQCVPAGDLPGHASCSACLTPELRLPPGAWILAVANSGGGSPHERAPHSRARERSKHDRPPAVPAREAFHRAP